jgi:hypothetical protein
MDTTSNTNNDNVCGRLDVIYINGICATPTNNAFSAALLLSKIKQSPDTDNINVMHFNNPSNGYACSMDLLEVLQQKIEENGGADVARYTIKDIVLFIISWSIIGGPLLSELYLYIFIKEVIDTNASNIAKIIGTVTVVESTKQELISKMENSLQNGNPLLLVAHSQGNLYMNTAYQNIQSTDQKYVKLLSVATPAAFVGYNGVTSPYVTRTDDKVINALRLISTVLSANNVPTKTTFF